jgi:hypothetical protein
VHINTLALIRCYIVEYDILTVALAIAVQTAFLPFCQSLPPPTATSTASPRLKIGASEGTAGSTYGSANQYRYKDSLTCLSG